MSSLDEALVDPKKEVLLAAQIELYEMQTAFRDTPQNKPELAQSLKRLQKRIEKKEAEVQLLEEEMAV